MRDLIQAHPTATVIICAVGLLAAAITASQIGRQDRDPQRMFNVDQRVACFTRAGHRCEITVLGFIRCQRPAVHADHHYPHSKGGATSMANAVAACARHNTSKGAHMPTILETHMIAARRRRYFPAGTPRRPGQWYRRAGT